MKMSNALTFVSDNGCDHKWGRYEDLPGGEDPLRYRQCTECGQIVAVMAGEHREKFHIRSLPCYICGEPAVGRNWGRRKYAARVRWVCKAHLKPRPNFETLLAPTKCCECGKLVKAGSTVRVRQIPNRPHRVYEFQCLACFTREEGADR